MSRSVQRPPRQVGELQAGGVLPQEDQAAIRSQKLPGVVPHGRRIETINLEVMMKGRNNIQQIDDDGRNGDDTIVHRSRRPRCPAAL